MRRGEGGWFFADVPRVKAGTLYKFRIDDEIDVPDPASAFQPDDISGPSELIDHAIGPVWEANHTWLIFCLVVLWSGFPTAFAAITLVLYLVGRGKVLAEKV